MPESTHQTPRSKPILYGFMAVAGLTLVLGIIAMLRDSKGRTPGPKVLFVHAAASLKTPLEKIAADYERETGTRIDLNYGGSQTLLANISIARRGDLYLPADDSYLVPARDRQLISYSLPIATQSAVIAVPKGNPREVRSLADLTQSVRLSLANPETAAIGQLLRQATTASGLWPALSNHTVVFKPNVIDSANDVRLGAVDAAIVWDSMRGQFPDLDFITVPELGAVKANVAVAVLNCSAQPAAAAEFARYIASPDHGLKQFKKSGFLITPPHL